MGLLQPAHGDRYSHGHSHSHSLASFFRSLSWRHHGFWIRLLRRSLALPSFLARVRKVLPGRRTTHAMLQPESGLHRVPAPHEGDQACPNRQVPLPPVPEAAPCQEEGGGGRDLLPDRRHELEPDSPQQAGRRQQRGGQEARELGKPPPPPGTKRCETSVSKCPV